MIRCCHDRFDALVHADIPQFDFATATATYKLTLTTTLQVHICDPLLVLLPNFDHGSGGLLALVVDPNSPITESSDKNITFDLVRCQRSDAGS